MEYLDIESRGLIVEEALKELELFIKNMRVAKKIIVKVIHGYGSTGVGGTIKIRVEARLKQMMTKNQIVSYIPGDAFETRRGFIDYIQPHRQVLKADSGLKDNPGITYIVLR